MEDTVQPISERDRTWLAQSNDLVEQMLRVRYGKVSLTRTESDAYWLQRLYENDKKRLSKNQSFLHSMGAVLGNVFTAQTSFQWAVVTNSFGTILALHDPCGKFSIYPLTMISKRAADGRDVNIPAIYKTLVSIARENGATLSNIETAPAVAWLTLFCKNPLDSISPEQMIEDVIDNDFATLAEQYDLDPGMAKRAQTSRRLNSPPTSLLTQ